MITSGGSNLFHKTKKYTTSLNNRTLSKTTYAEIAFIPFKTILWIHGLPLPNLTCMKKFSVVNILLILLGIFFELNAFYRIYSQIDHFFAEQSKRAAATITFSIINEILRFLFLIQRKKLEIIKKRVVEYYTNISNDRILVMKIVVKLSAIVICSETITAICAFRYFKANDEENKDYYFWIVPPPNSIACHNVSLLTSYFSMSNIAITCYFCSICYLLKDAIAEYERKLRHVRRIELDGLLKFHEAFMELASRINDDCHPLLVSGFSLQLFRVFREAYEGIFVFSGSLLHLIRTCLLFLEFSCICTCGSSVMSSASKLEKTMKKLSTRQQADDQTKCLIVRTMDTFRGFKIFNSIVINTKLILSALAFLVTYGLMIATFNITSAKETI